MHGSMWRELETEAPGNGHRSEAACQGKPGEKWLRDLTPDNATAPAPDPTPDGVGLVLPAAGESGGNPQGRRQRGPCARGTDRGRPDRPDGSQAVSGAGGGAVVPSGLLRLPAGKVRAGCGRRVPAAVLAGGLGDRFGHPGVLRHRSLGPGAQGGRPPHLTEQNWIVLYVQRWLEAPMQMPDGTLVTRDRGNPQGSAISPLIANLFMHYAFDTWLDREFPGVQFERYADDAVVHCDSERPGPPGAGCDRWSARGPGPGAASREDEDRVCEHERRRRVRWRTRRLRISTR